MIVKILKASSTFSGVKYNTNKIDRNKGELMAAANFGPYQGLGKLRPQDYINYLKMVSARNTRTEKPQFHAIISAKGNSYNKRELTTIAAAWLKEMGYGEQPYLIVFHKDTANAHVHMVSTRISRDGKKINSAFENRRAIANLNRVLGYEFAFQYRFSTKAQFMMLLESRGFAGTDPDEQKIQEQTGRYQTDKVRAAEICKLLMDLKDLPDFKDRLKEKYDIELMFHASEGKKPYGYTIIDHSAKTVFKGSEVLPLKELIAAPDSIFIHTAADTNQAGITPDPVYIQSIMIADDVDDQQVHGMRRRRQKKARTNTR
jgi:hypothetical protein